MFNSKKQTLIVKTTTSDSSKELKSTISISNNPFTRASMMKSSETLSGNGSLKYTTTGSDFVDDFGNMSNYRSIREYDQVAKTMSTLWSQDKDLALRMIVYSRMITRKTQLFDGTKTSTTQRGQGLKNEGILRMMWLAINHSDVFWKNSGIFISIGCWKDIFVMLSTDLQYNGWVNRMLNWQYFGMLILSGLENPNTVELVKKYLPTIKPSNKTKTLESQAKSMIGKWIASLLFGNKDEGYSSYKKYRKLKSSGTAHEWQQLISQGKHSLVNFDTIHGRALAQMVSGKYLENQKLEDKYEQWMASKPVAKFTGYPFEIFKSLGTSTMSLDNLKSYQIDTMDKQFLGLVEVAKQGMKESSGNRFIGIVDSSGSMNSLASGTSTSAYAIAKIMTLYLSYLLEGTFSGYYFEFSNETIMKQWKGETPTQKLCNDRSRIVEGTNFQSVADHFGKMLQQGIKEEDMPTGIICFSDSEFNNVGRYTTNYEGLKQRFASYGFSKEFIDNFKVILWDICNSYYKDSSTKFEGMTDTRNLIHISGLDPATLAFLTGIEGQETAPTTSDEMFQVAMEQEIMSLLEV